MDKKYWFNFNLQNTYLAYICKFLLNKSEKSMNVVGTNDYSTWNMHEIKKKKNGVRPRLDNVLSLSARRQAFSLQIVR